MTAINKLISAVRARLVDDLSLMVKKWSVWLHSSAVILYGYATEFPDSLNEMWRRFPDDLKANMGPDTVKHIAVSLFVLGFAATFIKQKRLSEQRAALQAQKETPQ